MGARNHSHPSNSLLSCSQQEAKEKEEAESRIKVKREAEKVAVMEGSYHNERMRFCSFSFKITHEITENLCERTQGSFSPGVDILFVKGQKVDILRCDTNTQLCCCSCKEARDHVQANGLGCVPIKLYLKKKLAGQILLTGHSLQTS